MDVTAARMRYTQYLNTLPLGTLRTLGRARGVPHATDRKKEDLINAIIAVLTGENAPAPPSRKGAPAKQIYFSPEVTLRLNAIREECEEKENVLEVRSDGEGYLYDQAVHTGYLELGEEGGGYLRALVGKWEKQNIFIPASVVEEYSLGEGDYIACTAKEKTLSQLLSVNEDVITDLIAARKAFESLTPCYPSKRLSWKNASVPALRLLDVIAPVGMGQRALIKTDSALDRITLTCEFARCLRDEDAEVCALFIGARPEEVTELRSRAKGAMVVATTFDEEPALQMRVLSLALAHAKRLVERGRNAVFLVDNFNRLFSLCEQAGEGNFYKKLFGSARNVAEGGSLTVLGNILVDTGKKGDERLFDELSDSANSTLCFRVNGREICLDATSFTVKGELLRNEEEQAAYQILFARSKQEINQTLERAQTVEELLSFAEEKQGE